MINTANLSAEPRQAHYYLRKQSEGHSRKEAMRSLKRRISDTVYRQLQTDS